MALDLTGLQPLVAGLVLADRCTVHRDPEGTSDDVISPGDLSYPTNADTAVVATAVPFSFRPEGRMPAIGEAGQPTVISDYRLAFEVGADVQPGDTIECTLCFHDATKVGTLFDVIEPATATFAVLAQFWARQRIEGIDRP